MATTYSNATSVAVFCRYLLDGQSYFNTTTIPTLSEVNVLIEEVSGLLNLALVKYGFSPANVSANGTAKDWCDLFVRKNVVSLVEETHPTRATFNSGEAPENTWDKMMGMADKYVMQNQLALKRLNISVSHATSEGLSFTGLTVQDDRSDPDDTSLEQPKFKRGLFDSP